MRRRQRKVEPPRALDPAFRELTRAFHEGEQSAVPGSGRPSADLCALGLELADALHVYERRGGKDHINDIVARPPFADLFSAAESQTSWPRPSGRWDIVLRRDEEVERVIGEAGDSWHVEGLARLKALARHEGVVSIDVSGSEDGLPLPDKQPTQDVKDLTRGADIAGGVSVVTSGPATEAYLAAAALEMFGRVLGERPPRWHLDPSRRHDMRFWNGSAWTRFVFNTRG
jgi:hypothetical protein